MYKALRHSKQILEFFRSTMGKILFPILCSFFFLCDKVFLLFYLIAKKIANGTVDFTYNGMAQNEYGWWKITNGTVDFSFNGIASNQYGYWVIANGGVDFSYNGEYTYGAYTYNVVNGYAMSDHVHTWNPIYGYRQVDDSVLAVWGIRFIMAPHAITKCINGDKRPVFCIIFMPR